MSDDGTSADRSSPPALPPESPGSSVSTRMQEEYAELLKFALTSGLQGPQEQEQMGDGAGQTEEEAFPPVISVGSSPRREEQEDVEESTPITPEAMKNTNSNNLNGGSSNDNAVVLDEADIDFTSNSNAGLSSGQVRVGPDVSEMGNKLDIWLGKLKGDILAELSRAVAKSSESQRKNHEKDIKDLVCEKQRLEREATRLGEQVTACEQSLARKDTLVDNLTQALQASKDQVKVARIFYTSRTEAADQRRLNFTEKLAMRHHEHQLVQRVMRAWFGLIQTRWRNRVQKACEEQARGVCAQLSQDYEDKIKSLNASIESLQQKVSFLQQERGQYAEQVRKAFMRGVCALNMETMSAFGPEEDLDPDPSTGHSQPRTVRTGPASYQEESEREQNYSLNANSGLLAPPQPIANQEFGVSDGVTYHHEQQHHHHHQQQQQQQSSEPCSLPVATGTSHMPSALDVGSVRTQPHSLPTFAPKSKGKSAKGKGRPGTAPSSGPTRYTARSGGVTSQCQPLAPPMASIMVERHNPVTKQTLGKATASKYPKTPAGPVSKSQPTSLMAQTFKPLAGQSGSMMVTSSIKVVD